MLKVWNSLKSKTVKKCLWDLNLFLWLSLSFSINAVRRVNRVYLHHVHRTWVIRVFRVVCIRKLQGGLIAKFVHGGGPRVGQHQGHTRVFSLWHRGLNVTLVWFRLALAEGVVVIVHVGNFFILSLTGMIATTKTSVKS